MHVRQSELHNAGVGQKRYLYSQKLLLDRLCEQIVRYELQILLGVSKS